MVEEVLPDVPYVQLVFTIPKMLRKQFLWDRTLYGELCRSAYAATKTFFEAQFPGLENPVPAVVAAPQSFGNLLNFHPHAHALSSLGVFTRDGVFHPAPEDIDFAPLEEPACAAERSDSAKSSSRCCSRRRRSPPRGSRC